MNFSRCIQAGRILLLISVAICLQVRPVCSQIVEPEHCSAAESELPTGLLPSQPQALQDKTYRHALAEFKAGQLNQAAQELQSLDFASARNALGVVLQALGDRDRALDAFQQARKLWPDSAEVAYNLANLMMQVDRPNAAIFHLQTALHTYRDHDQTRFYLRLLLAQAYRTAGNEKLAAQTLEALLSQRPNSAELRFNLASAYGSSGSFEDSVKQYREGLRLTPEDCTALMGLSKTLLQMGKASDAMSWLKDYVRLRPKDAEGYYVLGRAFRDLDQFTEAAAMFSKAVHLSPENYDMRYQFAMTLWKAANHDAALEQFEAAENLKPDEVQVHSALARVLSELGRKEEAGQETASAERLMSGQRDLDRASFCIGMGNTFLQRGDLKNAEAQFREGSQ